MFLFLFFFFERTRMLDYYLSKAFLPDACVTMCSANINVKSIYVKGDVFRTCSLNIGNSNHTL